MHLFKIEELFKQVKSYESYQKGTEFKLNLNLVDTGSLQKHTILCIFANSTYGQKKNIMKDRKTTKEKLLIEAVKLYTSKPYDRVTFADLEEVTGLSRGAILYHVKTKEKLFLDVVKNFIFDRNSVSSIPETYRNSLRLFITQFLLFCQKEKDELTEIGILNINNAMLNLEISAFFVIPEMREYAYEWYNNEREIWRNVVDNSISNNEIRSNLDIDTITDLFVNVYLGASFEGVVYKNGYKISKLEKELDLLYNLIKS